MNSKNKLLQIIELDVKDIIENPENTRKHDVRNISVIKDSLLRYGQYQPIIVNKKNIVLAGNGRLQAIKELGWNKVQVIIIDKDNLTEKAISIIDNRSSELATWDLTKLTEELELICQDDNFSIEDLGFEQIEMDTILKDLGDDLIKDEEIDISEPIFKRNFTLQISLATEKEQKSLYDELNERGFSCQVLKL